MPGPALSLLQVWQGKNAPKPLPPAQSMRCQTGGSLLMDCNLDARFMIANIPPLPQP